MSASANKEKSQKMAADLIKRGYPHGRRQTTPTHANYPKPHEVGSTKYQRLMASQRAGRK